MLIMYRGYELVPVMDGEKWLVRISAAGNDSRATGAATITYDTGSKKLTWQGTYSGLSGATTAGHFHGPAETGKNAGVAVPITATSSPFQGSADLTDAQAADLMAGRWYLNIHTDAHKGGEIRGQVVK
jgi:CHRD domain